MAQTKLRIVDKDPAVKLARQRLSVLQLAEALGSVSAACRRAGMDRTSFYDWKRRFQTQGQAAAQAGGGQWMAFQRWKVWPLIPCLRQTSSDATQASCSRSTAMICASLNLDFPIRPPTTWRTLLKTGGLSGLR